MRIPLGQSVSLEQRWCVVARPVSAKKQLHTTWLKTPFITAGVLKVEVAKIKVIEFKKIFFLQQIPKSRTVFF